MISPRKCEALSVSSVMKAPWMEEKKRLSPSRRKRLLLFPIHHPPPRLPPTSRKFSKTIGRKLLFRHRPFSPFFYFFNFFFKKKVQHQLFFSTSKRRPTCVSVCELFKSLVANWSSDTICLMTLDPMCNRKKKPTKHHRSFECCDVPCRPLSENLQETFYILFWFHFIFLLSFFFLLLLYSLTSNLLHCFSFFSFFFKKKLFLRKSKTNKKRKIFITESSFF